MPDKIYQQLYSRFRDVIKKWPGGANGCADDAQVNVKLVYGWINRDNIPPAYWNALIKGAKARGFLGVDLTLLADLAEAKQYPPVLHPVDFSDQHPNTD